MDEIDQKDDTIYTNCTYCLKINKFSEERTGYPYKNEKYHLLIFCGYGSDYDNCRFRFINKETRKPVTIDYCVAHYNLSFANETRLSLNKDMICDDCIQDFIRQGILKVYNSYHNYHEPINPFICESCKVIYESDEKSMVVLKEEKFKNQKHHKIVYFTDGIFGKNKLKWRLGFDNTKFNWGNESIICGQCLKSLIENKNLVKNLMKELMITDID